MQRTVEEWLAWLKLYRQPNTQRQYGQVIGQFLLFLGDPPPKLADLTIQQIERFIAIQSRQRCHNTVAHNLRVIGSCLSWASRRYQVPNVLHGIPALPEDDPHQRFLSVEEYAAVLAACKTPLEHDMIQLYGNTGLRREEMRCLRWQHVSADLRSLRVPQGKGNKARTVPLNEICRNILTRNHTDDTFLFLRRWRCQSAHNGLCNRLAGRAHIGHFGPHALRHYFATRMILAGVPLKLVSLILGHANTGITEQIYCHIVPVNLLGATDCLTV